MTAAEQGAAPEHVETLHIPFDRAGGVVTTPAGRCNCGSVWKGHPNVHAITCPRHAHADTMTTPAEALTPERLAEPERTPR
jgi:hypothetical protein